LTFFNSGKPILFPDITYSFYPVWANLFQIPFVCPPLDQGFQIRAQDYKQENGGIIFPNPNAPTGIYLPLEKIEEILQGNPDVLVIVDEAYIDFASGSSALALLPQYENLLVVRTFSKSRSLAGLRIGYILGNPQLIQYLDNVKHSFNSYTLNLPAQLAGVETIKDEAYFQEGLQKIIATREWFLAELQTLGFSFTDSQANFVFAKHERISAKEIFQALKKRKIYVRFWEKRRIHDYLRITIGTKEEMEILLRALGEIV